MDVLIGTSGYSYQDWVGDFYPPGTRPERMLNYYCQVFPLVELNFTFYRPPTRSMLERLADKTPPGFQFIVKAPQTISHDRSDADLPGFRQAVEGLARRGQLAGTLVQLPQATHCTRQECNRLVHLAQELGEFHPAVEFRHRSWARPGLPDWLAEQGLDLVAVDAPDLPGLFPSGWMQSSKTVYVRLHSRDASKWYRSGEERYDYNYSDGELNEWVSALEGHAVTGGTERAMFLFNNCQRSQAALNARRMQGLIEMQAPGLNLLAPPGAPGPMQRSLFG
jgi:uncharacterized protein YecE (DUF72 family)